MMLWALTCSMILSIIPSILLPVHCRRSWSSCCSSSHLRKWSQNDGRRLQTSWGTERPNRCLSDISITPQMCLKCSSVSDSSSLTALVAQSVLFPQFCLFHRLPAECRNTSLNLQKQEFQSRDELQTCACTTKRSGTVSLLKVNLRKEIKAQKRIIL